MFHHLAFSERRVIVIAMTMPEVRVSVVSSERVPTVKQNQNPSKIKERRKKSCKTVRKAPRQQQPPDSRRSWPGSAGPPLSRRSLARLSASPQNTRRNRGGGGGRGPGGARGRPVVTAMRRKQSAAAGFRPQPDQSG